MEQSSPTIQRFLNYLKFERRFSEHTAKCYGADLVQFGAFRVTRSQEQGQHQRDKVDSIGEAAFNLKFETGAHELVAARRRWIVDGYALTVFREGGFIPSLDRGIFGADQSQIFKRPNAAGVRFRTAHTGDFAHVAHGD